VVRLPVHSAKASWQQPVRLQGCERCSTGRGIREASCNIDVLDYAQRICKWLLLNGLHERSKCFCFPRTKESPRAADADGSPIDLMFWLSKVYFAAMDLGTLGYIKLKLQEPSALS